MLVEDELCGFLDLTVLDSSYKVWSCPERNRRMRLLINWLRDGPFFSFVVGARMSCSYRYTSWPAATSELYSGRRRLFDGGAFFISFVALTMSCRRSVRASSSWYLMHLSRVER